MLAHLLNSAMNAAFPVNIPVGLRNYFENDDETSIAQDSGLGAAHDVNDVLKTLPRVMGALKRLRKSDPDAYAFLKLGAPISTDRSLFLVAQQVPNSFLDKPPVFRAFFWALDPDEKGNVRPVGFYMMRDDSPMLHMKKKGAVCYRVSAIYDEHDGLFFNAWAYALICSDGNVKAAPVKMTSWQRLPNGGSIPKTSMAFPEWLSDMSHERGSSIDEELSRIVVLLAGATRPSDTILVRATDCQGTVAAWNISKDDAKRFFARRKNRSKKILHFVDGHERVNADGSTSWVRPHYRGARAFEWSGYKVKVSGLGFHHNDFYEAPIAPSDQGDLMAGDVSERVERHYDAPVFLSKARK